MEEKEKRRFLTGEEVLALLKEAGKLPLKPKKEKKVGEVLPSPRASA